MEVDGLIKIAERHNIKNRREGFILHNLPFIFGQNNRRFNKITWTVQAFATGKYLAPFSYRRSNSIFIITDRLLIGQRPHQCVRIKRVTNGHLLVSIDQGIGDAIHDGFMDNQATGRCATLTGSTNSTENDTGDTHSQVSCFIHDDGIIATQFQQAAAHAGGDFLTYLPAYIGGPGERYQVDTLVIDKTLGQIMTIFHKAMEDRRIAAFFQRRVTDVLYRYTAQQAAMCRLPDGCVTTDGSDKSVPCPNRNREVEG